MLLNRRIWTMTRFDFTPLFRSSVGFDRLTRMLDAATRQEDGSYSYPPYNIETTGENAYRITMAVAGFGEDCIAITAQGDLLVIPGKRQADEGREFLFRGLPLRSLGRRF